MRPAVFLDRDGVLNKVILKEGKPFSPRRVEDFELSDGAKEFLVESKKTGFLNIVITNQPDIARGCLTRETLETINSLIKGKLPVDDIFVCPHDDINNCCCRKPKPGMLLEAAKKWNIDLKNSFIIGDQWKDVEVGKNVGCSTILIDCPYNKQVEPDFRVGDLLSATAIILNSKKKK